jgi:hypothetical protein
VLMLGTGFAAIDFFIHDIRFSDVNSAGAVATGAGNENSFCHRFCSKDNESNMTYQES